MKPCSPVLVHRLSKKHDAYIFRAEEYDKQEAGDKHSFALIDACFLLVSCYFGCYDLAPFLESNVATIS